MAFNTRHHSQHQVLRPLFANDSARSSRHGSKKSLFSKVAVPFRRLEWSVTGKARLGEQRDNVKTYVDTLYDNWPDAIADLTVDNDTKTITAKLAALLDDAFQTQRDLVSLKQLSVGSAYIQADIILMKISNCISKKWNLTRVNGWQTQKSTNHGRRGCQNQKLLPYSGSKVL